jgi:hypothetical protein
MPSAQSLPPTQTLPDAPGNAAAVTRAEDPPAPAARAAAQGAAATEAEAPGSAAPLAAAQEAHPSPERQRELHLLWSRLRSAPWRSLVLVPAAPGIAALDVATGLLQVARLLAPLEPLQLLDARGRGLEDVAGLGKRLAALVAAGQRVLLVTDSALENPATLALSQAADAGLLCARLGMDARHARETLALCGRERFVGSVLVPT